MNRVCFYSVIQLPSLFLLSSCYYSPSSREVEVLNEKHLYSPLITQNINGSEIEDFRDVGKGDSNEKAVINKVRITPAQIFFETYPSLVKAREECKQWALLGIGGQLFDVVEHSSEPYSKSLESARIVVKAEKRVCDIDLLAPRVKGSYVVEKDGTYLKVLFKEFRH